MIGALLRLRRESCSLSQRQVAELLDRKQAFVWKVEHGIQHVDIPTLIDFAKIFNTTAAEIVRELEQHQT